jgi:putative transposase
VEPAASCADRQSITTATQGTAGGFDGNKKAKGRKRHMLVATCGLIVVVAANSDDRQGLVELLQRYCASGGKRLRKIWVDGGYEAQWLRDWVRSLKQTHEIDLEVVKRTGKGFERGASTAGKWNARWRGYAMIVVIVAIMRC